MPIDYRQLRKLPARKITRALLDDGFCLRRQEGSHKRYTHPDGRRVTVTAHKDSDTFPIKTLKSMIEIQACWNEDDLKRLELLS